MGVETEDTYLTCILVVFYARLQNYHRIEPCMYPERILYVCQKGRWRAQETGANMYPKRILTTPGYGSSLGIPNVSYMYPDQA